MFGQFQRDTLDRWIILRVLYGGEDERGDSFFKVKRVEGRHLRDDQIEGSLYTYDAEDEEVVFFFFFFRYE